LCYRSAPRSRTRKKCRDVTIVCIARNTEHLDGLKRFKNVRIEKVNYEDERSLEKAFKDVTCTIFIPELNDNRVQQARNTVNAMQKERVKACLMVSVEGADSNNTELRELRSFREIEQVVERTMSSYLILRKSIANQTFLLWSPIIRERAEFPLTLQEDCKMTPLDLSDFVFALETIVVEHCQQKIADELEGFGKHKNKTYTLTGPQQISPNDLVHKMNKIVQGDKNIQFKHVSREELRKYLRSLREREDWSEDVQAHRCDIQTPAGGDREHHHFAPSDELINLLLDELELVKKGEAGFVSDDLQKITGRQGKSIEEFLRKEKNEFKPEK